MKNQKEMNENEKILGGGVKWYREKIIDMVNRIEDEKFLNQIRIILKRHIEKRGF